MKIYVEKIAGNNLSTTFKFSFELESDDKKESISFNAGKAKIFLESNYCTFDFPFDVAMPHPDLVCMAALKIISPYIGSKVEMDRPVSKYFAEAVKERYQNIKSINTCDIEPRHICGEKYAVSFSGGADSLAAANLCPPGTPLILSARKYHPEIGVFEPWYKTSGNIETLKHMPDSFCKIYTLSDFEFLSTNHNYCIYPDNYAFTIPCILLADHLSLTGILVGDVLAAFTANETKTFSNNNFSKMRKYYASIGLDIDSPVKGVTEIGTEMINRYYHNDDISNTCQYGEFRKPCMKCIKCFRKTLIRNYLSNIEIDNDTLTRFNESNAVINFYNNNMNSVNMSLQLTYKGCMKNINVENFDTIQKIKNKAFLVEKDVSGLDKLFDEPYYNYNMSKIMHYCLCNLHKIFSIMNENEAKIFLQK